MIDFLIYLLIFGSFAHKFEIVGRTWKLFKSSGFTLIARLLEIIIPFLFSSFWINLWNLFDIRELISLLTHFPLIFYIIVFKEIKINTFLVATNLIMSYTVSPLFCGTLIVSTYLQLAYSFTSFSNLLKILWFQSLIVGKGCNRKWGGCKIQSSSIAWLHDK